MDKSKVTFNAFMFTVAVASLIVLVRAPTVFFQVCAAIFAVASIVVLGLPWSDDK
jgi:hypothetical protein